MYTSISVVISSRWRLFLSSPNFHHASYGLFKRVLSLLPAHLELQPTKNWQAGSGLEGVFGSGSPRQNFRNH